MTSSPEVIQVSLRKELSIIFSKRTELEQVKRKDPDLKPGTIVNEFLLKAIEWEKELTFAEEMVDYRGPVDDGKHLLMWDKKQGRPFTLVPTRRRDELVLKCREDNSEKCIHVGLAFVNPKINKRLIELGFKAPKSA